MKINGCSYTGPFLKSTCNLEAKTGSLILLLLFSLKNLGSLRAEKTFISNMNFKLLHKARIFKASADLPVNS